ncbi:MAG: type IV secretion system protein, partial [Polyangiaceae bacterium]
MQFSALTLALQNFISVFGGGFGRMSNSIHTLLAILIGIELLLMGFWWALNGGEQLGAVFKKLLFIGFWIWLVQGFPGLAKAFVDSLVTAGVSAGGGTVTVSQILDPSALAASGLDATEPLANKLGDMGTFDVADMLVFGLGSIAIMAC